MPEPFRFLCLPLEIQLQIFTILSQIDARLQHHSPLTPNSTNSPLHPLIALSAVSRYFCILVESVSRHLLTILKVHLEHRLLTPPPSEIAEYISCLDVTSEAIDVARASAEDPTATNLRSVYINFALTRCRVCGSPHSVSGSVLGNDDSPICLACDWANWEAMFRQRRKLLAILIDGIWLLVTDVLGLEYESANGTQKRPVPQVLYGWKTITSRQFGTIFEHLETLVLESEAVFSGNSDALGDWLPIGEWAMIGECRWTGSLTYTYSEKRHATLCHIVNIMGINDDVYVRFPGSV